MKPRWTPTCSLDAHVFVGSFERFDLYRAVDSQVDLRVVWGSMLAHWTWLHTVREHGVRTLRPEMGYYERGGPTMNECRHILTYVKCFVPELAPHVRDQDTLCGAHNEGGTP